MACTEPVPAAVVERAQPAAHLAGRALGERHRQHLARRDVPGRHQVGDAPGDGPGLAGPRARQHAHRAAGGEHRLALLVVEIVDERERGGLERTWRPSWQGAADKADAARRRLGMFGGSGSCTPYEAASDAPLTMYTTTWCGYCSRLKTR